MNAETKNPLPAWLPYVVGAALVVQFAGLGAWQISRGLEKREDRQLYRDETGFTPWHHGQDVRPYQRLEATGRFDNEHQVLLENIIVNSRYGYYVVTPLLGLDGEPVLLVNRGWLEKPAGGAVDVARLDVPAERRSVRGRVGSLPRAGMKMGEAFNPGDWPRTAVYPSLDEVAAALGRDVQPFVLLMHPGDEPGFLRHWKPSEFGPGKHFAYAFQWFAMAAVLSGLLAWNHRKKRFAR